MNRGLDRRFLAAMRFKLDCARGKGYVGWDRHWNNCCFEQTPRGPRGLMMRRLLEEVEELRTALYEDNRAMIIQEAADVANFAMMIADIHDAMDFSPA